MTQKSNKKNLTDNDVLSIVFQPFVKITHLNTLVIRHEVTQGITYAPYKELPCSKTESEMFLSFFQSDTDASDKPAGALDLGSCPRDNAETINASMPDTDRPGTPVGKSDMGTRACDTSERKPVSGVGTRSRNTGESATDSEGLDCSGQGQCQPQKDISQMNQMQDFLVNANRRSTYRTQKQKKKNK